MIFEVCTDSIEGVLTAERLGANRVELCSALSVGGLTPNIGLIKQCVSISSIEIHVMIRHREGSFNYSKVDVEIMKSDIIASKEVGAKGVVFGILTEENEVSNLNKELVSLSKSLGLEVTFHRAFDFVQDYKKAISTIIEYGFGRLLTSGLKRKAEEGLEVISFLQKNYGNSIQIMAGSGINALNALKIAKSGINNIHFTARKTGGISTGLSMGEVMVVDEEKIKSIITQFK
jgi:copper homeostasis protein